MYDPNPNPFFYTFKAAGIIDVLDRVNLNFGISSPTFIKARQLLLYNNISGMFFKDTLGITQFEVHIDYNYNESGYPITANVNAISDRDSSSNTFIYTYK